MPPEAGKREDNSITARPCGTKKKIAANTHNVSVAGPAIAAVPRCRNPKTATRLNKTRSRSLSARTSWTGCEVVGVVSVAIILEKREKNKRERGSAILAERRENEQIQASPMQRVCAEDRLPRPRDRGLIGDPEYHFFAVFNFPP